MKNYTSMMIGIILLLSTMMIICSKNWINMWIGMEINLMSFIPIMLKEKMNSTSESAMIYFLVQSLGSILFLISIINSFFMSPIMSTNINNMIMLMSMLIKLGSAPFHYWMIMIASKISWLNILILMTWQKIGPMSILSMMNQYKYMNIFIILSVVVGAIGSLNFSSLKIIMTYSSINHLGWLLASIKYSNIIWIMYIMIYSLMMIQLTYFFIKNNIKNINQFNFYKTNKLNKTIISMQLLSLGGLPPMIGFWMKISVVYIMMLNNEVTITLIMILSSLMTLFVYIRSISTSMLWSSQSMKYKNCNNTNNNYMFIMSNIMYIITASITMM